MHVRKVRLYFIIFFCIFLKLVTSFLSTSAPKSTGFISLGMCSSALRVASSSKLIFGTVYARFSSQLSSTRFVLVLASYICSFVHLFNFFHSRSDISPFLASSAPMTTWLYPRRQQAPKPSDPDGAPSSPPPPGSKLVSPSAAAKRSGYKLSRYVYVYL